MEKVSKDILLQPTWEDLVDHLGGETPAVKPTVNASPAMEFETQTFERNTAEEAKAQYAEKIVGQKGVIIVDPEQKTIALHERAKKSSLTKGGKLSWLWSWAFRNKANRITSGASIMLGGQPTKSAQEILDEKIKTRQSFGIEEDVLRGANDLKGKRYAFVMSLAKSTKKLVGKTLKSKTKDKVSVVSFDEARTKLTEAKRELELKVLDEVEKLLET